MAEIQIGNLPSAATLQGGERVPLDQTTGANVSAAALVPGQGYRIVSVGATNWQACGVPAGVTPVMGLQFLCSAAGSGDGLAIEVVTRRTSVDEIAALASGAISEALSAHEAAADPHPSYSTAADVNAAVAAAVPGLVASEIAGLTHLDVGITGALSQWVRNDSGVTLPAGTPVKVSGMVGGSDTATVVRSRQDDPATLPAAGVLAQSLAAGAEGHLITSGPLGAVVTTGMVAGATLWVGAAGGLTTVRTEGSAQRIGTVGKVASNGTISVDPGPVLATVGYSGQFGDLDGRPQLGTSASLDVGTTATTVAAGDAPAAARDYAIQRANHTGEQAISTITGLSIALQGKASTSHASTHGTGGSDSLTPASIGAEVAGAAAAAQTAAAIDATNKATAARDAAIAASAPANQGVTNGNNHDHSGGDGAQIAYGSLSGLPTLFDPANPGAIGGGTPAAGTFTALDATTRFRVPSARPALADRIAGQIYQDGGVLYVRNGANVEERPLTNLGNLANLSDAAVARANLGAAGIYCPIITLTPSANVYTIDVTTTSGATLKLGTISTSVTINLANGSTPITSSVPANIPTGTMWQAMIEFVYSAGGTITFYSANTGIALVRFTPAPALVAGKTYRFILDHERGGTTATVTQVGESQ